MARIARADVGPLAAYANGYRELLVGLGYTPDGVVRKLWELGRLSDWMIRNGLGSEDLTAGRFDEFSALCAAGTERPVGYRTLGPLVGYLRGLGVVPEEMVGATPVDELVDRYRSWMVIDRALAARTIRQSVSKIVYDASRRAGMDPPVCSHRLRHALATDMLAAGVRLPDISQVLRHRDLATTAIYAKVDHAALRELAVAWPRTEMSEAVWS